MSQYVEKYKKNIVIDMRKRGYSYSEIGIAIHIPKSTIAFWLKDIKLTPEQKKKLEKKRSDVARSNFEKRKSETLQSIEEIKKTSAKDIKEISKKELWLMGIVLYWRERLLLSNKKDLAKGVNFTSSDPYLIKLFLKWLEDSGGIKNEEILFDIFINSARKNHIDEAIEYWSDVTENSKNIFTRIYYQNSKNIKNKKEGRKRSSAKFGLLRIRVRSSSLLARQISGWMNGLVRALF